MIADRHKDTILLLEDKSMTHRKVKYSIWLARNVATFPGDMILDLQEEDQDEVFIEY